MKSHGIARIGRDAEVRYIPSGEAVVSLSLAFTYGRKGPDGKRPTQWVEGAFWGKRAETLAPYLLKGSQIGVDLEDTHIETYAKADGTQAFKLAAKVVDVTLISGQAAQTPAQAAPQRQAAPAQRPAPARQAPAPAGGGFDDMDDDIPF